MPGSSRKKKHGGRKDKKTKRMREDVEQRHQSASPPKRQHDTADKYPKHIGRGSDASRKKGT